MHYIIKWFVSPLIRSDEASYWNFTYEFVVKITGKVNNKVSVICGIGVQNHSFTHDNNNLPDAYWYVCSKHSDPLPLY